MNLKILDFKNDIINISWKEILKKYSNNGAVFPQQLKLSEDELKSALSILFALDYHFPKITIENKDDFTICFNGHNNLFNITRDFGRQMIENIDDINKEKLVKLQNKSYKIDILFKDEDLFDFRQTALLDYMNIRKWEYGKYFIQNLSKLILDSFKVNIHSHHIRTSLQNDGNYLKKIGEKIIQTKVPLETHEGLLLVFVIKENMIKNKTTLNDYCIANFIAKDNIGSLNTRIDIMKKTLNDSLTLKWNLNRGKGGPKL